MKRKKIIAVTGARSDYDLLYTLYKELDDEDAFDFSIIITGPHLSDAFGYTAQYIENDGFKICAKIHNLVATDKKIGRIVSIGNQIPALANVLSLEKPDIVLIPGDREEAITTTMTCAFLSIPVAHFFGGDIAKDGNIDNSVRYASGKFAHLHFTTLPEHKENLIKLGEDDWRIFVVGNPAIDRIVATEMLSKKELFKAIDTNLSIDEYCVLIQHPIISQIDQQAKHIRQTLDAILAQDDIFCFINYPNSDAGFEEIVKAYNEYAAKYPDRFHLFSNLNRLEYINLLRHSSFLIGNSSSGIVEVASLGLPTINVGERQRGREHGNNVIFTDNNQQQIEKAIEKVMTDQNFIDEVAKKENPYGNGDSTPKIINILKNIEINNDLIYKNITY